MVQLGSSAGSGAWSGRASGWLCHDGLASGCRFGGALLILDSPVADAGEELHLVQEGPASRGSLPEGRLSLYPSHMRPAARWGM